jgi:hypothetical protein
MMGSKYRLSAYYSGQVGVFSLNGFRAVGVERDIQWKKRTGRYEQK